MFKCKEAFDSLFYQENEKGIRTGLPSGEILKIVDEAIMLSCPRRVILAALLQGHIVYPKEENYLNIKKSQSELINKLSQIEGIEINTDINSCIPGIVNFSVVGYNVEEDKYGVFADANVLSVGYDGRYIDAGISVVGVGFILGWEDKKFRFKIDLPGWFGFDISIDFGQIIWVRNKSDSNKSMHSITFSIAIAFC